MSRRSRIAFEKLGSNVSEMHSLERNPTRIWPTYDSSLNEGERSFSEYFRDVIPAEYRNIGAYVEDTLAHRRGQAIGIELGGTGSRLFSDFTPGFFSHTLGTVLNDLRDRQQQREDTENHHEVIATDMFTSQGKKSVEKWLGGKKADFIMQRMWGGLIGFPENPDILHKFLNRQYRWLGDNGILFNEVPPLYYPPNAAKVLNGLDALRERYKDTLDLKWHEKKRKDNSTGQFYTHTVLRIRKLNGAPQTLSLLDEENMRLT